MAKLKQDWPDWRTDFSRAIEKSEQQNDWLIVIMAENQKIILRAMSWLLGRVEKEEDVDALLRGEDPATVFGDSKKEEPQ